MSLQWQFAAYILYVETFLVLLLALPFISNKFWYRIFKFKFFSWIGMVGQHAFLVVAGILSLLFLDSIREIQKYEKIVEETEGQMGINMNNPHTNKFRAQRNFYITLGAFLFWVVLRRLVTVISRAAHLGIGWFEKIFFLEKFFFLSSKINFKPSNPPLINQLRNPQQTSQTSL